MPKLDIAKELIQLNKTFQYLKISNYLEIISGAELIKQSPSLLKQLERFYLSYHSMMSRFPTLEGWNYNSLYSNTHDFRLLSEHQKKFIMEEDRRINDLFVLCSGDPQKRVYLCMYYANYWIALLDGFRVSYWLYKALDYSKTQKNLSSEMKNTHSRLKELVLATLSIAPYEKCSEGSSGSVVYFDFDTVTRYIIDVYGGSIDEFCQSYSPRLSIILN